jgi:DNA-3-methyladenine glycosylase II
VLRIRRTAALPAKGMLMTTRVIMPVDGPFSLPAAAGFGFGPHTGRLFPDGEVMRLAFVADDLRHHVGAVLSQQADGSLLAEISGDADPGAAQAQIRRVLSIDVDPAGWLAAGQADPVLGGIQLEFPGLRPVLFYSPYEAAAWAMLAQRRQRAQATAVRRRLSDSAGPTFELAGEAEPAFPLPERLLQISSFPGIDQTRLERLHGVARAALAGQLEAADLAGLPPEEAMERLGRIKGLGPFYSMLVYLRATGVKDALAIGEPRVAGYLRHYYQLDAIPAADDVRRIAEPWRPFRTWAVVLFRVAGDRDGLPFEQPGRRR